MNSGVSLPRANSSVSFFLVALILLALICYSFGQLTNSKMYSILLTAQLL